MSGRPGEGLRIACGRGRVVRRVLSLGLRQDDRASKLLLLLVAVGDETKMRVRVSGCRRADGDHSGFGLPDEGCWVVSEDVDELDVR